MDNLSQLALRTQTIFGGIHFMFFLISWPFVIGFLKDYHDNDRLTFNCIPKPEDFTRQRCYDNYTSAMSLLPLHLTPLDFAGIAYGGLGIVWASFILMGAMILRRIQRERSEQRKRKHSKTFVRTFIAQVCIQLVFLGVMVGLFCTYQRLHFPAEYKCHQTNITLTSRNQRPVNITCNDLRYKEKSKLNIAIIGIMAFSIVFCLLTLIHLAVTRKAFPEQLLGDIFEREDGNPAGLNLVDDGDNLQGKVSTVSEAVKKSIKKQTEFLPKLLNVSNIPSLRTDEIFTNLLIQRGRKPVGKVEYTGRRDRLVDYSRVSGTQVKESQEIFFRTVDDESNPKRILLTGKAGIGKSLFCQKLLRDWANDELFKPGPRNREFPDFTFAYLLTFRQLSLLGEQNVSLQDILNCCTLLDDQCRIDDLILQYLVNHPEEVLIVIDGYDEYSLQDYIGGNTHERYPNSCQEKMPVAALCAKLINGQILGQSTVLVTSRPDESDKLCEVRFHRNVEITGFSEQEVTEYIKSYFRENESMKNIVLEHITENEDLLSFAHVPVLCALMCSHFEWILKASNSSEDLPVKISELYSEVLTVFERNHIKKKQTVLGESTLDKLSDFAAQSLLSRKFEFTAEEMKRLNLEEVDVEALRRGGLLHCGPPFMISISQTTKYFCFTHFTVHEYLAARSFVKGREIPEDVSTMVLQFIAGILSKTKDSILMEELLKKLPVTKKKLLLQAQCLCEYNDKEFARNHFRQLRIANNDYGKYAQFEFINDVDCIALEFLLDFFSSMNEVAITSSNQSFSQLIIRHSFLTLSGVKRICRAFQSNFCPVNRFTLSRCGLKAQCVQQHIRVLVSTKLLYLNLSSNQITDDGVASLSEALKQSTCQLTTLDLTNNKITDDGVASLSEALKQSTCQLTTQELAENQITDDGVASLPEALKQSTCQLTTLELAENQITDHGVASLSEALKQSACQLTTLYLGGNQITDDGVASLSEALKQSTCQLTKLYLPNNHITDNGVASLSEALEQSTCQLTTLDLADNQIADHGVASLSEALKQSTCQLTTLYLNGNQINDDGVASLSEALKQSTCQLTTLDLANKHITDDGVASLSEALKQSTCQLTTLYLAGNHITDDGADSLREALKQSTCQLTTLHLAGNQITDDGVAVN